MDKVSQFFKVIESAMAVTLATASGSSVTMRVVSPAYYDGKIRIGEGETAI